MARILVTPRSLTAEPPQVLSRLEHAGHELIFCRPGQMPSEAELIELIAEIDGWLAGVEPVSPAVVAAAERLRIISRNGSGIDNLPLGHLEERGIAVARAMAANAAGVAELAVALALAACRHLPQVAAGVRAGEWPRPKGREIDGAVVGIVGMGAIGRRVARTMLAMNATVLAVDPFRPALGALAADVAFVELDELLPRADIVSLHCPMPADGRPMIDGAALARMKGDAILINTARAQLVEEEALLQALDRGALATYATDVFAVEPPSAGGLAAHPRVIATSHIGGLTDASVHRATEAAVDNLLAHLADGAERRATA